MSLQSSYLTPEIIIHAYMTGIFPMANSREGSEIHWVNPELRGVIPLNSFHIPRRLQQTIRTAPFQIKVNHNFEKTIKLCQRRYEKGEDTWINEEIVSVYTQLAERGYAHSIECYDEQQELVGGIYGLSIRSVFFGESMFSIKRDASKIALTYLIARLRYGGYTLFDTQFQNNHLIQFGTVEVPRKQYHKLLNHALQHKSNFHSFPVNASPDAVLQATGHKSKTECSTPFRLGEDANNHPENI